MQVRVLGEMYVCEVYGEKYSERNDLDQDLDDQLGVRLVQPARSRPTSTADALPTLHTTVCSYCTPSNSNSNIMVMDVGKMTKALGEFWMSPFYSGHEHLLFQRSTH